MAERNHAAERKAALVVTGASSGIGAATASTLARAGFTVFAGVRALTDGESVAALHPNIRAVSLDVTDVTSIAAAARSVAASALPLAGVVNNAGIAVGGPLEYLPVDELRRQFEVNVFGPVAVTQAFLGQLRADRGRLIFVGSVSGRVSIPFQSPYSASKFALRALTDALRVELAPWRIFVSLVEPGSVKTPIWRKGRQWLHLLLERLGPRALEHYKEELEALFRATEREERAGMPVERVSGAILEALTSPAPRAHYAVGSGMARYFTLLPATLQDRILRASLARH